MPVFFRPPCISYILNKTTCIGQIQAPNTCASTGSYITAEMTLHYVQRGREEGQLWELVDKMPPPHFSMQ